MRQDNAQSRGAISGGIAVVTAAIPMAGCTINCSPIHANLSAEKLDERVAKRFHKGMLIDDVRAELHRVDLTHQDAQIPSRQWLGWGAAEQGIRARVLPHGLIGMGGAMFGGGHLYFWFGERGQLEMAGYGGSLLVLPIAYRPIALRSSEP